MPCVGKQVVITTFRGEKLEGWFGINAKPAFVDVRLYTEDGSVMEFPAADIAEIKVIEMSLPSQE